MASRERPDADDDDDDKASQHRRSRLWLGYSEDNLRNSQKAKKRRSLTPTNQPALDSNPTPNSQHDGSMENCTVPDDYDNLDEVAAPSPVEDRQIERQQGYLEDREAEPDRVGSDEYPRNFENLDEVAAPSPIGDPLQKRKQGYLEDSNINQATLDGSGKLDEAVAQAPVRATPKGQKGGQNGDVNPHKVQSSLTDKDRLEGSKPSARRHRASKVATEVYTISYLVFFSILGTLARLGLQALTFYPGAPVQTGLLWANVGGSLILGFLSEDRKLFREEWGTSPQRYDDEESSKPHPRSSSANQKHAAAKKTIPLYIGLAIGFCGSFTSFSSFMRDAFFALSNALPVPIQHPSSAPISQTVGVHRNPGYSFLALLAVLIITIGLSLMSLQFGAHIALFLEPFTPSIPYYFSRKIVDRFFVFLAFGCWFAAIVMSIWPPDRPGGPVGNTSWMQETWRSQTLLALVFAPLGCLLRFYASIHLNGRVKAFPLGTFAVNMLGTALEAMFIDLQRVPVGNMVGCQVLQGMSDGFCGCLTTVSTWVVELSSLRLRHAYFYGLVSVGMALSLLIIITGSLQWTKGFSHPLCIT